MKTIQLVLTALGLVTLIACSKPEPINEEHSGELAQGDETLDVDNSYYDEYEFSVAEGMTITATMTSDDFDTYLHLIDPSGEQILTNDDADAAGSTNSQIVFTATATGKYAIYANSLNEGETGAYNLTIVTTAAAN